jgi:thiosulfate/3-mercaptopyruvate sulfurtransferase
VKTRWLAVLLALALALGAFGGLAGCTKADETKRAAAEEPAAEQPVSARGEYLVSVADVAAAPESFVLVDARAPEAYAAGHIAGAINAPWQTFASVGVGKPGDNDWGTLLPASEIGKKLGELGADATKPIVVYADPTGWGEDGRVVWTLRSVGIEDARMMDGGFPAWTAGGNASSTDAVKLEPATVTVATELNPAYNITTDELKAGLETLKIIDSRAKKEYDGATDFGEARGGHIPGAVNIPYPDVFNSDGTVKSDADLRAMFDEAGLTDKTAEAVFYCTKGIRSGHMSLLARMLGYENAKNYDASFYTWAGNPDLPVEK